MVRKYQPLPSPWGFMPSTGAPSSFTVPETQASSASGTTRAVILQMDDVPVMDVTGLVALETAVKRLHKRGIFVAIAGVQAQPREMLAKAGLLDDPTHLAVCATDEEAIAAVRRALG